MRLRLDAALGRGVWSDDDRELSCEMRGDEFWV